MEAIVFTKTPSPIISDDKYWMVDKAWKIAIEAQDRERALAGAPVGTPSVCYCPVVHLLKSIRKPKKLQVFILVSTPRLEL